MSTMDRLKDTRVWDDALSRVLGRIEATANSVERGFPHYADITTGRWIVSDNAGTTERTVRDAASRPCAIRDHRYHPTGVDLDRSRCAPHRGYHSSKEYSESPGRFVRRYAGPGGCRRYRQLLPTPTRRPHRGDRGGPAGEPVGRAAAWPAGPSRTGPACRRARAYRLASCGR